MTATTAHGTSMPMAIVQYDLADQLVRMVAARKAEVASAGLGETGAALLARFGGISPEGGSDAPAHWTTPQKEQ